jgi:hypothetical protein
MNIDLLNSDEFNNALLDYFYLIDRNFPEKASLKLVGDRYRLVSELRTLLYRGICSEKKASDRRKRITNNREGLLIIDGYNVLFTLLSYRLGRFVFISYDNICRDAGSLFGNNPKESLFAECAAMLTQFLTTFSNLTAVIYLDSPISSSEKHKILLEDLFIEKKIKGEIYIVHSADSAIMQYENCTLATSDSAIIDANSNPIIDIPRAIIEKNYNTLLFDIQKKLISLNIQ